MGFLVWKLAAALALGIVGPTLTVDIVDRNYLLSVTLSDDFLQLKEEVGSSFGRKLGPIGNPPADEFGGSGNLNISDWGAVNFRIRLKDSVSQLGCLPIKLARKRRATQDSPIDILDLNSRFADNACQKKNVKKARCGAGDRRANAPFKPPALIRNESIGGSVGSDSRTLGFAERHENQADTNDADRHPDYRGDAHGAGPDSHFLLGLKIAFIALAIASGLAFWGYALKLVGRREVEAAAFNWYVGWVGIMGGLLGCLMLYFGF
jgi:hypothetical protein